MFAGEALGLRALALGVGASGRRGPHRRGRGPARAESVRGRGRRERPRLVHRDGMARPRRPVRPGRARARDAARARRAVPRRGPAPRRSCVRGVCARSARRRSPTRSRSRDWVEFFRERRFLKAGARALADARAARRAAASSTSTSSSTTASTGALRPSPVRAARRPVVRQHRRRGRPAPCVFDPAVYVGHHEAGACRAPAQPTRAGRRVPRAQGARFRTPEAAIRPYHILNHANLFGGGYHDCGRLAFTALAEEVQRARARRDAAATPAVAASARPAARTAAAPSGCGTFALHRRRLRRGRVLRRFLDRSSCTDDRALRLPRTAHTAPSTSCTFCFVVDGHDELLGRARGRVLDHVLVGRCVVNAVDPPRARISRHPCALRRREDGCRAARTARACVSG